MNTPHACPRCLRRTWLLALLAPYIERATSADPATQTRPLLVLGDEALTRTVAPQLAEGLLARVAAIQEDQFASELQAAGCWATCRHDQLYPSQLRELPDAPAALVGRGDPEHLRALAAEPAVALLGARRATSYGRELARQLGRDLADAGFAVIGGLAFGIDACAHRGALDAGLTVAVLGSGADAAYPAAHRSLWRRICERGLVLSELAPGASPWRWTFPARNRIIAGLAGATVVVEAAARSGSLGAAEIAAEQGRVVGAVPGPVSSLASQGTNGLLAEGAVLIREAGDVRRALERPRRAGAREAEPAYTAVGLYQDNRQPYLTTVYTFNGPQAALELAQAACAEENDGEEVEIVALFEGEPRPVAFDAPRQERTEEAAPAQCNLHRFLIAIAEGLSEQFEAMEDCDGESGESLALRDYHAQLLAVAEAVGSDGRVDWGALADRVAVDLAPEGQKGGES
jgi:DNA processing protein